jgi:ABC-type branched-subunit amino acid transport system substrate-binding protein
MPALLLTSALLAAACAGDDGDATSNDSTDREESTRPIEYEAIGLWDDGPCDRSRAPLVVGLMTVFESPTISLGDQAQALEAAATAFNARGGANGACIEVVTCDDGADFDQSLDCVSKIDEAGVVATINDTGLAGQAEVSAAMAQAGIPRVASTVTPNDSTDANAFPTDSAGLGYAFLVPRSVIDAGATKLAVVRVSDAAASALLGFLQELYDDDGVAFVEDLPVPAGTTDYTQFIVAAENAGADGIVLALGEQEGIQVIRAGQQLGTDLLIGSPPLSHAGMTDLGDFAGQLAMVSPYPPPTTDLPVYAALRDDLAASGELALQTDQLKPNAMRSWIGLYALLWMIRDADMQEFTGDAIATMLRQATDVPMLGIYGDQTWTPDLNHPGTFQRAGVDEQFAFSWDLGLDSTGFEGSFVEEATISFDETLCGSPIGGPEPC